MSFVGIIEKGFFKMKIHIVINTIGLNKKVEYFISKKDIDVVY